MFFIDQVCCRGSGLLLFGLEMDAFNPAPPGDTIKNPLPFQGVGEPGLDITPACHEEDEIKGHDPWDARRRRIGNQSPESQTDKGEKP